MLPDGMELDDMPMEDILEMMQGEKLEASADSYSLPNLFPNSYTISASDLSNIEMISGIILAVSYFIIGLSILSYGLSILSVGETLMFVIFKKKSDDDDLLLRKDEDELEDEDEDEYLFTEDETIEDKTTEDKTTEDETTED